MPSAESQRILMEIESAWTDFRAEVAALGEAGLDQPTVAGWTAKEMAAHVAFWAEAVEGFVTGMWRKQELPLGWTFGSGYTPGDGPWPHFQVHNAREAAWARERGARAALERLDEAHGRLTRFVETVTEEEAASNPQYWADVAGHLREHLDELRGMPQQKLDPGRMLASVEESWRPFKSAVDALSPADLDRQTVAGWTGKELLGHIAFWDEAAVGAIIGMLRRQPMPPGWGFGSGYVPDVSQWPTADVHNAREAAWARNQSVSAVLTRLERAHAGLIEVLGTVTQEEIDRDDSYFSRLGNHYREHRHEVEGLR